MQDDVQAMQEGGVVAMASENPWNIDGHDREGIKATLAGVAGSYPSLGPHVARSMAHDAAGLIWELEAERDAWERALRALTEYAVHGEDGTPRDLNSLRERQSPEPGDLQLAVVKVLTDLWQERARVIAQGGE